MLKITFGAKHLNVVSFLVHVIYIYTGKHKNRQAW